MTTPSPSMHLLPDGTVLHDYGEGSCFSCGGNVTTTYDDATGTETALCAHCGGVDYMVAVNDAGEPLQGFIKPSELVDWPHYDFLDPDEIPY
jgi:hypothetical protein